MRIRVPTLYLRIQTTRLGVRIQREARIGALESALYRGQIFQQASVFLRLRVALDLIACPTPARIELSPRFDIGTQSKQAALGVRDLFEHRALLGAE
jgi:hypothetical protein